MADLKKQSMAVVFKKASKKSTVKIKEMQVEPSPTKKFRKDKKRYQRF